MSFLFTQPVDTFIAVLSRMYEDKKKKEIEKIEDKIYIDWVVNRANFEKAISFNDYKERLLKPIKNIAKHDNDGLISRIEAVKAKDQARAKNGII